MDNPGLYNLGDAAITAALTEQVITDSAGDAFIDDLDGMLAATVQVKFNYGSGGTECRVFVQTSLDQGATWVDIVCFLFAQTSEVNVYNISGLTPHTSKIIPTDAAGVDDTAIDGILGERWRAKVTSTGTYGSGTTVSARLIAR